MRGGSWRKSEGIAQIVDAVDELDFLWTEWIWRRLILEQLASGVANVLKKCLHGFAPSVYQVQRRKAASHGRNSDRYIWSKLCFYGAPGCVPLGWRGAGEASHR